MNQIPHQGDGDRCGLDHHPSQRAPRIQRGRAGAGNHERLTAFHAEIEAEEGQGEVRAGSWSGLSADAKPKPWTRPNRKLTSQRWDGAFRRKMFSTAT